MGALFLCGNLCISGAIQHTCHPVSFRLIVQFINHVDTPFNFRLCISAFTLLLQEPQFCLLETVKLEQLNIDLLESLRK